MTLPTNPLHLITLASVATAVLLGIISAAVSIQGSHGAADAWFIGAAMSVIPGIAAISVRIFMLRKAMDMRTSALVMMTFPAILALALGIDALDQEASHRMLRGIGAVLAAAGMTPAAATLIMRDR